jgi:hypothetical protein
MTNEQQQSPIFCLDKLKKHLYNTIWGIKQLLIGLISDRVYRWRLILEKYAPKNK